MGQLGLAVSCSLISGILYVSYSWIMGFLRAFPSHGKYTRQNMLAYFKISAHVMFSNMPLADTSCLTRLNS